MTDQSIANFDRIQALLNELERLAGNLPDQAMPEQVTDLLRSLEGESQSQQDERLAACAAELYRLRRRRERQFGRDLLGEPCWDLMLDLFANAVRGVPVSVTGACVASNVPTTTALRWLAILEERDLVTRYPDPYDRRVVLVRLTDNGMERMRTMLSEVDHRGFTPREVPPFKRGLRR